MLKNADSVRLLKEELDKIDDADLSTLKTTLLDMGFKSEQVEEAVEGIRRALDTVDDGADGIKRSAQEIENLKN
jgi:Holliday junction resolvasome RuvABC DNA-binding subunit